MGADRVDRRPRAEAKEIGLAGVFSIAAGAMVSSGLFVLPGIAYAKAGPAIIAAYLLAGILVVPVLLANSELATAMPQSGGNYFFIERCLGPLFGTVAGLADWFAIALKATFALIGIGALIALLFPGCPEWLLKAGALGAGAVFAGVNIVSTRESARMQAVLVFLLLVLLAGYCVVAAPRVLDRRFIPFAPNGMQSVLAVAGMVFVSYGGLTKVVAVSGEVRDPSRNLPGGMLLAFVVVNLLYLAAVFVTVGVVEGAELAGNLAPLAHGARVVAGKAGGIAVGLAAFLAFATTANAGIMAASRAPMAMSRDGLLPAFFSTRSERFGTPVAAVTLTSLAMMALILFLSVEDLVKTASTMMLVMFIMVNITVIVMRHSGLQNYRPTFKVPFFPWLPLAATGIYGVLIAEMGAMPLLLAAGFVLLALLWYVLYVRRRIERKSALLYLVKRILSRHIGRSGLDEELMDIVLERDEITFDRFDHLVRECPILDIPEAIDARALFQRVAEAMGPRVGVDPEQLNQLLLERERESSTVVETGLAVPHVVVPGEQVFELALVRCGAGATFSELNEPVRIAFVLLGSADQRNYHLRALMAIAQIVREEGFQRRWLEANGVGQLRDMVLLSSRPRDRG